MEPSPSYLRYAQWIGLALIALVIVPVAIASADLGRRAAENLLRAGYVTYDDNDALRITPKGLEYLRTRVGP